MSYIVKAGDTFWQIAQELLGDGSRWREIADLNPDSMSKAGDPRTLQIGATLLTEEEQVATPAQEPVTTTETPAEPAPTSTGQTAPADTSIGYGKLEKVEGSSAPGLLRGGQIFQIERPGLPDAFVYAFEYPLGSGSYVSWSFDSLDQIEAAVGDNWFESIGYSKTSLDNFTRNFTEMEDIGSITGMTGNFYSLMSAAGLEAAAEAGINDPTLLGRILNDPEMQSIMAQDTFGDLTDTQVMAMKRDTNFWKNVLYPGIENLYDRTSNPELAWSTYHRSIEDSLVQLGIPRDQDGSYKSQVGKLLNLGVEDATFNDLTPSFVRAQRNIEYGNILNQWTERDLGKTIGFNDWYNVIAGETPAELADVVEKAGLQFQAEQQGVAITSAQVGNIAALADLTEAQAASAFTEYEQILTSLAGSLGNNSKYDLTSDEILSLATGIKPASGRSHEEIRRRAAQAAREADVLDDKKLQFFVGYDVNRGTPNRPGLNPLAPESG